MQILLVSCKIAPAAGIDQKGAANGLVLAFFIPRLHFRTIIGGAKLCNRPSLANFSATLPGMIEQELIKNRALYLKSLCLASEPSVAKDQFQVFAGVSQLKLGPEFDGETGRLQFWQYPHFLKELAIVGQERFADMKPREAVLFEDQDTLTSARQKGRDRTAAGTAANHQGIIEGFGHESGIEYQWLAFISSLFMKAGYPPRLHKALRTCGN
jgi:hypothetical protein